MNYMIAKEIAQKLEDWGVGIYQTADDTLRTIFTGELPYDVNEGLFVILSPSPPPHQYIDTEYTIIDFWYRSAHTDRAYDKLRAVYDLLHRRSNWDTANWHIYFSQALGGIVDADRDANNGKLLRLSVQFISRNLNSVS